MLVGVLRTILTSLIYFLFLSLPPPFHIILSCPSSFLLLLLPSLLFALFCSLPLSLIHHCTLSSPFSSLSPSLLLHLLLFPFYLSFLPLYRPPSFTLSIHSPHSSFFLPSLVLSFISHRHYPPSVQFAASDGHQGGDCCPGGIGEHPQSGQSNKRSR